MNASITLMKRTGASPNARSAIIPVAQASMVPHSRSDDFVRAELASGALTMAMVTPTHTAFGVWAKSAGLRLRRDSRLDSHQSAASMFADRS